MSKWAALLLLLLSVAASAQTPSADATFTKLLADEWQWTLEQFPTRATSVGDMRYNDRMTDNSEEAVESRRRHARELVGRIRGIDRAKLTPANQLNYDLFLLEAEQEVEGQRFRSDRIQITQRGGVYSMIANLANSAPKANVRDYENLIKRVSQVPRLVEQSIAQMRKGMDEGITPPRITLRDVSELITNHIKLDPTESPIYQQMFRNVPATISVADQERLRTQTAQVIRDQVMPSLRKLRAFFVDEYRPKARPLIGLSTVPDGREWYAYLVRNYTTSTMSPDAIHDLGLSEVKRIRAEMEKVKEGTGFKGTLAEFFTFLRTDSRFYFTDREALLAAYRDIAKRVDPELPKVFGTLPRLPYGVVAIPEYTEKTQTTAYYNTGSIEGGQPGLFYANTYNLAARPKWEMEALTLHEAVPGHHLQLSLAQELGEIPEFRRFGGYTAFIEGWGLYAESLGPELGLYKDPYSKFGQLTYEMWRAIRLVVDTGMHSKGWTRQQAIDYFKENAGKTEHDITVEIDRYINNPGQALAYKIGELKFKELRAHATKELGDRFDVRKFHDVVLGAGALPLTLVDARVRAWVTAEKASGAKRQ